MRTPVENAEETAVHFPNSWHLIVEDGGHDDDLLIATSDIGDRIEGFFSGDRPTEKRSTVRIGG